MKIIIICSQIWSLHCVSLLRCSTCPRLLCSQDRLNISLTLPFNACACLLCHAVLHLNANTAHHVASPSLIDLSSTVIPVDDEEEDEEEETYDDIEGLTNPPPPRPGAVPAPQIGRWGGGQETGEVDEEDEDIYEVLPGMRMWLPFACRDAQPSHTHTQTHTDK